MKNKIKSKTSEEITIDMPEVKDIPGQEHIKPPRFKEMMDVTASSADEEGEGILDDLNKEDDDNIVTDNNTNVGRLERKILSQSDKQVNAESEDLDKLALDKIDEDDDVEHGDPLDMGEDLDIPGSELDDEDEDIGEEDEENNSYSRPD
ncbi:MAG: hypothetical protein QM802_18055 [Agriterribacter sp.]